MRYHATCASLLLLLCACAGPGKQSGTGRSTTVFFATNRKLTNDPDPSRTFGTTDNGNPQNVIFGKANVSLPANHAEGSSSGVRIQGFQPVSMPLRAFYLAADPGRLPASPRNLLVYVHGYNNSFADAATRGGVFAADLAPNSAPSTVIYSWPSAQQLLSYWKDEDSVQLNQPNLRRFLFDLHLFTHPDRTTLVGHSMGCRAVTFALRDLFLEELISHGTHLQPMFEELVFIEPDVNAEYFRENLVGAKALCRRITIYTDSHDLALKASHTVHQYQSLGLSTASLGKNVDIIDASAARNDLLGHSYDGPAFFGDLKLVMRGTQAPQRPTLTSESTSEGVVYRLLKP